MFVLMSFRPQTKTAVIILFASIAVAAIVCRAWMVTVNAYFEDRIAPRVSYGFLQLGGLTKAQALSKLEDWQTSWWNEYLRYRATDESGRVLTTVEFLPIALTEDSQSNELVWYDTEAMLGQALAVAHDTNPLLRAWRLSMAYTQPTALTPVVQVDELALRRVLQTKLNGFETEPLDARYQWTSAYQTPKLISEQNGNTFDYDGALVATKQQLQRMRNDVITIQRADRIPHIDTLHARAALDELTAVKGAFPVTWTSPDLPGKQWIWQWTDVYRALQPVSDPLTGGVRLQLREGTLDTLFRTMELGINIEPVDARFEIDENKHVNQFQPSQAGRELQRKETLSELNQHLLAAQAWKASHELALVLKTVEPAVMTDDVNDLGIHEILGVGYSNFSGSPRNRIHNIGIGISKLHGTLIAPDEEFSLLKALKPFSEAAGYLPELVIKGDKIEPEVGGGLCQIGSTTFRAAMNSGLKVTERRNHSLVVSYYNDPRNGKPGTDATIYDSSPDLKFINDTGHYILIMTDMNKSTGDLTFTFWGTKDGRQASYSEPVVSRWIPAGETQYIPSEDLKAGEQKCQSAHNGAVASFVYTVVQADGEKQETTFVSNYRPLPEICLVGKEDAAPEQAVNTEPLSDPAVPLS